MEHQDTLTSITDSIEHELRRLDLWSEHAPGDQALASAEPFCYDTLNFSQWVQWIFLPRVRELLETQGELPPRSNIFAYAEEAMRNSPHDADQLLFLIKTFDELVAAAGGAPAPTADD